MFSGIFLPDPLANFLENRPVCFQNPEFVLILFYTVKEIFNLLPIYTSVKETLKNSSSFDCSCCFDLSGLVFKKKNTKEHQKIFLTHQLI